MKELRRYLSEFSSYCQGKNIYFADELTPAFMKTYASTSGERPFPHVKINKANEWRELGLRHVFKSKCFGEKLEVLLIPAKDNLDFDLILDYIWD